MNDTFQRILGDLYREHGARLYQDHGFCKAVLADRWSEAPRESKVILDAVSAAVPQSLLSSASGRPLSSIVIDRLAKSMADSQALTEQAALWAVETWSIALGFLTEKEARLAHGKAAASRSTGIPGGLPPTATRSQVGASARSAWMIPAAAIASIVLLGVAIFGGLQLVGGSSSKNDDGVSVFGSPSSEPTTSASAGARVTTPTIIPTEQKPLTDSPTPSAEPTPKSYASNWSTGSAGWTGSKDWTVVDSQALSDGSLKSSDSNFTPAYVPSQRDYAVEAEVEWIRCDDTRAYGECGWGIVVRDGYYVGICYCFRGKIAFISSSSDASQDYGGVSQVTYTPDNNWHVLRVEVQSNNIRFLIDGQVIVEAKDNKFLDPGKVRLWSHWAEVSVKSFRVDPLQ